MKKTVSVSLRVVVTLVVVALAAVVLACLFRNHIKHPWTRDGQVRAQVIQIAPRVSGPIVELPIADNGTVRKGDLLFKIDPRTYEAAVEQAQAAVSVAQAAAAEATIAAERVRGIYAKDKGAVPELYVIGLEKARDAAEATVVQARASLTNAVLNLEFTEVRAPADGHIANLRLRPGSQVVANQSALALIDLHSFWIHGFFKETQIRHVDVGDPVVVKLMAYPKQPLEGVVESVGWGIAQQDGSPGVDLLPNVNPTFDWIRLAQRIPVRVKLTDIPEEVELRVGTTASVLIQAED